MRRDILSITVIINNIHSYVSINMLISQILNRRIGLYNLRRDEINNKQFENVHLYFSWQFHSFTTRCPPSLGRRCIPDVVLKNKGSVMQTYRNIINVHVVNTD